MDKRILTTVVVVALGVILGLAVIGKKSDDPVLRELLKQQSQMLNNQQALQANLNLAATQGQANPQLEARVANLERQMGQFEDVLRRLAEGAAPQRPAGPPPEDYATKHEIPVAHSPVKGPADAPVTVVEFLDFQCPFCARFHEPVKQAVNAYPDRVNLIIKNFPLSFHPQARPAAKAAFAAGEQGKYWEMAELLLDNVQSLSEEKFGQIAEEIGLNVEQFWNDYRQKDAQWEEYIQNDLALGQQVEVRGTPTIFIDGHKTRARDVAAIKQEIEKALAEAGQ